jgi:predicted ATPase
MIIKEVSIKGFRSLWDVSITDFGTVNVFFGENNSGKSNILEALETIFKVEQKELPVSGFYRGALSDYVDNFTVKTDGTIGANININCKIAVSRNDIEVLPAFMDFLKQNSILKARNQLLELEVEITPSTYLVANKVLKIAKINSVVMYDSSIPQPGNFFPGLSGKVNQKDCESAVGELFFYLINSFNKIHTGRFMETREITEGSELSTVIPLQRFKDWFRVLIESRGEDYKTYQKIQGWFDEKPFVYGKIRPIFSRGKTDILIEDSTGRELMLERLGTGVQQILILLSQIAARVYTNKAKIFGIEELELNLSPNMQREALNVLKNMASSPDSSGFSQVFLTSHSPYLCNRDFAELYAVSIDNTSGTQVKHGENAARKLIKHFKYDDFNLARRSELRK